MLPRLRVEPALLSVFCRQLNQRRQMMGLSRITSDLVAGHRQNILSEFYEQSLEGLAAGGEGLRRRSSAHPERFPRQRRPGERDRRETG